MMVGEAWMHRMRRVPSPMLVKAWGTNAGPVAVSPACAVNVRSAIVICAAPWSTTQVSEYGCQCSPGPSPGWFST